MKLSDIMEHAGLSMYAEVALVLFLFAFAVILWWVLQPANRQRFESDAAIPLDDMNPQELRGPHGGRNG
jgi:cbb3-type cytochrome oxidase subunit 3